MLNKNCLICQKEFEVPNYYTHAKYCSQECYGIANTLKPKVAEYIVSKCLYCSKDFTSNKSQHQKYCCRECVLADRKNRKKVSQIIKTCLACKEEFESYASSNRTYCSVECAIERPTKYKTGYIYLTKFDKTFWFRSSYEEKALKLFNELDSIKELNSEVTYIPYRRSDETLHHYVVDYTAVLKNNIRCLIEIKPEDHINLDINIRKFESAKYYALTHNFNFYVLTERDLVDKNSVETTLFGENQIATTDSLKTEDIVQTTK